MTTRKAIIYSLLIPQVIGQLILFISFLYGNDYSFIPFTLSILVVSILGLIFGVIISVIFKTPRKERWFYASGQILAFGLVLIFILKKSSDSENREDKFKNARDRYLYLYHDSLYSDMRIERTAIEKLESEFDAPNSFLLNTHFTIPHDTIISGKKTTVYDVYFAYDAVEKDSLFSKIIVLNDSAFIVKFNVDVNSDEEFQRIQTDVPREFKKIPDSLLQAREINY
jgi:hypothetical protein